MVNVSVVIATLKPRDEIDAVRYLEAGTYDDFEIIIRDEAPVCKARNEGIKRAKADKIVFLDDDSFPREDYLERAVEVLEQESAYAGRTVHPRPDVFERHFTAHYNRGDEPRYVDTFWGNNMGARREVFETVGGWDENMGWGHEEKELAARVRRHYRILYHPDLVVTHTYAESIPDFWRKQFKLETQTPYYWSKLGYSRDQQMKRTFTDAVNPKHYLRRGVVGSFAKAGAQVARTAGRIKGLLETADVDERDLDSGVPTFSNPRTDSSRPTAN